MAILIAIISANYFSVKIIGYNVIDRVLFPEESDVQTIYARFDYWNKAIEMGRSSLFGVGLGNYYDNLPRIGLSNNSLFREENSVVIDDPHNMLFSTFSNSGIFGVISLILLLFYFFFQDVFLYKKNNNLINSLILAFWGEVIFLMFNPLNNYPYLILFWFTRAAINSIRT